MKGFAAGFAKFLAYITAILGFSAIFSLMAGIHGTHLTEAYFSQGTPNIIALLDSEFFMGLIFVITLGVIIYVLKLMWDLHEIAVHKAQRLNSAHTQVVFALSLCGLFIDKTWWVLAIIIAFARWDIIADQLSAIINRGLGRDDSKGSQS
ncbi:magnesium transporter [Echinimonas agarilytica]|uniref:Magnesium transporter n=1 Tax=Echinimonas agarilytica TaxID=1215918 RepID=A0AA41W3V1_9GAMM|nr:magnesium transporter [Echinimonas agarilytica]MCM2678153.1 magnesium transporter [Echinimonas agarilytica]